MNCEIPFLSARYWRIALTTSGLLVAAVGTSSSQIVWPGDFGSFTVKTPSALTGDFCLVAVNVFTPGDGYLYRDTSSPPVGGSGSWEATTNPAEPEQGVQRLLVSRDSNNNTAQFTGDLLEMNVFSQFVISRFSAQSSGDLSDDKLKRAIDKADAQPFVLHIIRRRD